MSRNERGDPNPEQQARRMREEDSHARKVLEDRKGLKKPLALNLEHQLRKERLKEPLETVEDQARGAVAKLRQQHRPGFRDGRS